VSEIDAWVSLVDETDTRWQRLLKVVFEYEAVKRYLHFDRHSYHVHASSMHRIYTHVCTTLIEVCFHLTDIIYV
jgi:hypothetical protein